MSLSARLGRAGALVVAALAAIQPCWAENIIFPDDAGVVNVKAAFGARGDGQTDDTSAIQRALDATPRGIVYLPNGTYVISRTLRWANPQRGCTLQGQSTVGTVIKLQDGCAGQGMAMIWTGQRPAQRFRNYLRNLTLDTGKANPGAIGAQFIANNAGGVFDVVIRSGDGQGLIGLDLGYTDEQGPCLIKNVHVVGFDVGISMKHAVDSVTLEHIRLEGQNKAGLVNEGQCVSLRGLTSTNAVPAVRNLGGTSVMTLVDCELKGIGAALGSVAVENSGTLFARNVRTPGYRQAILSTAGSQQGVVGEAVEEFVSHPVSTLFGGPHRSLSLPIEETPDVPWDDLKDWASVTQFGASPEDRADDTAGIQKAIDAGKTTVYFPRGARGYRISGTILIRGNVRRIVGCESSLEIPEQDGPGFKLVDGASPVVVFERFAHFGYTATPVIENASSRTLVVRNCTACGGVMSGSGDVFLEDTCGGIKRSWHFGRQNVWARQLNVETRGKLTHVVNDGGSLWILGFKTENPGTLIENRGGGKVEVLGGFVYALGREPQPAPMFINYESSMSVTIGESNFIQPPTPYTVLVRETRGGETKELKKGDTPPRGAASIIPLYVGWQM